MEKSLDIEFEEWELIPDTSAHNIKLDSKKDLLISDDIDSNYFSDDKDSKKLKLEFKDIEVVPPPPPPPPPIVLFKKLNDDQITDMKIGSPKFSIKEVEGHDQNEEEDEFYKDENDLEKEIAHVEPAIKEKQAFWMVGSALCSIGVAAATICIIVLGKGQLHKNHNQKIQFQLYTDEKRIKEVVKQATKMNHALSAVRGASNTTRAHISFGGYYDGI